MKAKKTDLINFKLRTRLLIDADSIEVSRCKNCNSILVEQYAPPGTVSVIEKYNPEDKQSLMAQFCNLMRQLPRINQADSITYFIEKQYEIAQKNN